jgi:hypothetical protein
MAKTASKFLVSRVSVRESAPAETATESDWSRRQQARAIISESIRASTLPGNRTITRSHTCTSSLATGRSPAVALCTHPRSCSLTIAGTRHVRQSTQLVELGEECENRLQASANAIDASRQSAIASLTWASLQSVIASMKGHRNALGPPCMFRMPAMSELCATKRMRTEIHAYRSVDPSPRSWQLVSPRQIIAPSSIIIKHNITLRVYDIYALLWISSVLVSSDSLEAFELKIGHATDKPGLPRARRRMPCLPPRT